MPSLDALIDAPELLGRRTSETVAYLSNTEAGHASPCFEKINFDGEGFEAVVKELIRTQTELAKIRHWQAEVEARLAPQEGFMTALELAKIQHWQAEMEARLAAQESFMTARTPADTNAGLVALGKKDYISRKTYESAQTVSENARWYRFDKSVYDAAFFMLGEHVGVVNSMLILVAFIVNMTLSLGLILVLDASFTEDPLPDKSLERLREWRRSAAHAYYNADAMTGVSLSARVCIMDESLSLGTSQVELYKDATLYLDWGFIMGNIAVILWSFTCASKLRKSLQFIWALLHLTRTTGKSRLVSGSIETPSESLTDFYIAEVSIYRLLTGCLVALCQGLLACLLLVYGSWWLAYTISVFDLLLNASALTFVFEIDRVIFSVLLPLSVDGLLTSVRPLRLPRSFKEFRIPSALAIGIVLFVIWINLTVMQHIHTQVHLAESILCSESSNLDFIIGTNSAGLSVYAMSVPSDAPVSAMMVARQTVTQLLIDRDPEADLYVKEVSAATTDGNLALVQSASNRDLVDMVLDRLCVDRGGVKLGGHLWMITGDSSLKDVTACAQLTKYCRGGIKSMLAKHVRLICPVTCGCANPTSGLWDLASSSAGCPWRECRVPFRAQLETYDCQDKPLQELQANSNWSSMLDRMQTSGAINTSVFNKLISKGCYGFQRLEYFQRVSLCGLYDVFRGDLDANIEFGAGVLCPESCGCFWETKQSQTYVGLELYLPGDPGICPMKSCWTRWTNPKKWSEQDNKESKAQNLKGSKAQDQEDEEDEEEVVDEKGEGEWKKEFTKSR